MLSSMPFMAIKPSHVALPLNALKNIQLFFNAKKYSIKPQFLMGVQEPTKKLRKSH